jgi:hypothetical protein
LPSLAPLYAHARRPPTSDAAATADAGTAVQKARKLIERDNVDFLVGNINSALAQIIVPPSG